MQDCLSPEQFQKYDRGELDRNESDRVKEHLTRCAQCRFAFDQRNSSTLAVAAETTQLVPSRSGDGSSPSEKIVQTLPQIDGYQIVSVLGQGGMGVVYRATQIKLNRTVALKVLPSMVASPQAVARFRREAKAAARLHHTNIVPIYDFGESKDGHFYAMELIEGQPLNDLIKNFADQNLTSASQARVASVLHKSVSGAPSAALDDTRVRDGSSAGIRVDSTSTGKGRVYFQQVARWIADAADALHYAHHEGIIHRDIKPGNMILSKDARIMVTDFGLAKCSDDESVTVPGVFMGAIRYVSPEQAMAGRLPIDHRTDIWSLGATLYELLTFVPAFPGTDEKQILSSIITKDPALPRKLNGQVPAELETICMKTLEKDPDHRYPTARALAEDLQRWLDDIPIVAKRPGALHRSLKFIKRNRAITTAAVSIVLVSAMIWVFAVGQRQWKAKSLLQDGRIFEKEGDWERAAQVYRQANQLLPNNPDVLFNLARSLQEQYDRRPYEVSMVTEAVHFCERARELDRNLVNVDNTYGVLLSMNNQAAQAIEIFKKDLVSDAPAAHVWNNIAAVYYLDGKDQQAMSALQNAIDSPEIMRQNPEGGVKRTPYFHAYHELATLQLLKRDPEAAKTIQKGIVLSQSDKHFGYYLIQARILLTMPALRNDIEGYNAIFISDGLFREKQPDPYIKRYLALALIRKKDVAGARTAIASSQEARDLPAYTDFLVALAEAKAGNAEAARSAMDEAERQWPPDLKAPGSVKRSRHLGMIWFESADELLELKREVQSLLESS